MTTPFASSAGEPKVITIDRTKPFDPIAIYGEDMEVDEQDKRSLRLTELDLNNVSFVTMLRGREPWITGEEKLRRLKVDGSIRLDIRILRTLWKDKHLIPERWKEKTNGNTTYIFFDGTVLRNSYGRRFAMCLFWDDVAWNICQVSLEDILKAFNLSAVVVRQPSAWRRFLRFFGI